MPLSTFSDDVGRYEVRLAGSGCPGPRFDLLALTMMVAGAPRELGRAAEARGLGPGKNASRGMTIWRRA